MRGLSSTGWFVATCLGLCHCALDDRSPREAVASSQPAAAGAASTSPAEGVAQSSPGAVGSAGSAGGGSSAAASAGSAGSSPGVASGVRPGADGAGNAAGSAGDGSGAAGSGAMEGEPTPIDLTGVSAPVLNSGSCPAFSPCGGELAGSWLYVEACPTTNLGLLLAACPTGSVAYEAGEAAALVFSNGQVTRSGAPVGDGVVTFPAACNLGSCATLAVAVGAQAQCNEVQGDCACRAPFGVDWGRQAYTLSGSQLTLADGRGFEYCVEADRLTYRETGSATEPGVYTLQRN